MNMQGIISEKNNKFIIPDSPKMIFFDLTEYCNLKCWFCYNEKKKKFNHADTKTVFAILDMMRSFGCEEVIYLGGEPTLHPDFFSILDFGQSIGLDQCFVSNGQIIDEDFAKKLKKYKNLQVGISLHSHIGSVQNNISGNNSSFQRIVSAIKALDNCNINWYSQTSVTKENYRNIIDIYKFISEIGRPSRMDLSRMVECSGSDDYLTENEYIQLFKFLNSIPAEDIPIRIEAFPRCWLKRISHTYNLDYGKIKKMIRPCYSMISQLSVDIYGNVRNCPTGGANFGNILTDGLHGVWNSTKANYFRCFDWLPKQCIHCEDFLYCAGACKRTIPNLDFSPDSLIVKEE